jgi:hypothetical protein
MFFSHSVSQKTGQLKKTYFFSHFENMINVQPTDNTLVNFSSLRGTPGFERQGFELASFNLSVFEFHAMSRAWACCRCVVICHNLETATAASSALDGNAAELSALIVSTVNCSSTPKS